MAYIINKWDGSELSIIQDGTLDLTLDIKLVGKNYAGYGEIQNETFLHMLENFSGTSEPPNAIKGQLWYDSADKKLKVFSGEFTGTGLKVWKSLGNAQFGEIAPTSPSTGELWFDLSVDQLKVWLGTEWLSIGPQNAGEGITQMVSRQIKGTDGIPHQIIAATIGNEVVYIIAKEEFTIDISDTDSVITGFDQVNSRNIKVGITFPYANAAGVTSTDHVLWGNVSNALNLGGVPAEDFIDLLQGNFVTGANFGDIGYKLGDLEDLRVYVDAEKFIYIESQSGNDLKFTIKDGLTVRNPLTMTAAGMIPGSNNFFNLGSTTRKWKNVYSEYFRGIAEKSDQLKVGENFRIASVLASDDTIVVRDGDGNISANQFLGIASSAEKLETPVTINSISFDGSASIVIEDDTKVKLSGDTMTGFLTLHAAPTQNLHAATKLYVDTKFGIGGILPISSGGTNASSAAGARTQLGVPSTDGTDATGTWNISVSGNAATATKANNLTGGAAGSIPYQSGADSTAFLPIGDSGRVLTSSGSSLQWSEIGALSTGSASKLSVQSTNSGSEYRLLFRSGTTNESVFVYFDTDLKYDAGANYLTTNVSGNLRGNIVDENGDTVLSVGGTPATSTFAGTAGKANAFNSSRTITISGVVNGSTTWDGSGNVEIVTSVGNSNTITLGTDTQGNYVQQLTAGTDIQLNEGVNPYAPGEGDNVTISVVAYASNTANGIVRRDIDGNFSANVITATLFDGLAAQANYADLAEKYLPDQDYEPGTVVSIGGEKEITASSWGDRAIGVISTNPAFMMNKDLEGGVYVALKGRVPCKVIGAVRKGQRLIAANNGCAVAAVPHANDVFAIALESSDDSGIKIIEAIIL